MIKLQSVMYWILQCIYTQSQERKKTTKSLANYIKLLPLPTHMLQFNVYTQSRACMQGNYYVTFEFELISTHHSYFVDRFFTLKMR